MDADELILKFVWKGRRFRSVNIILKNKVRVLTFASFKTYYREWEVKG
jgi:hypothetical protein